MGCSPWGGEESDTTERLHFHFHFQWLGLSALSAMAQIQSLIGQGTRIPQATQHAKANKQTRIIATSLQELYHTWLKLTTKENESLQLQP